MPRNRVRADVERSSIRVRRERNGGRLTADIPTGEHPERFVMVVLEADHAMTPAELRALPGTVHAWHRGGSSAAIDAADLADEYAQGYPMAGRFLAVELTTEQLGDELPDSWQPEDSGRLYSDLYSPRSRLDGTKHIVVITPTVHSNAALGVFGCNCNGLTTAQAEDVIESLGIGNILTRSQYEELLDTAEYSGGEA